MKSKDLFCSDTWDSEKWCIISVDERLQIARMGETVCCEVCES
jgi:hypothetical protein